MHETGHRYRLKYNFFVIVLFVRRITVLSVVVSIEGPWNCIPLVRFMVTLENEQFEDTKVLIRSFKSALAFSVA
jgi:hypothetical protein